VHPCSARYVCRGLWLDSARPVTDVRLRRLAILMVYLQFRNSGVIGMFHRVMEKSRATVTCRMSRNFHMQAKIMSREWDRMDRRPPGKLGGGGDPLRMCRMKESRTGNRLG